MRLAQPVSKDEARVRLAVDLKRLIEIFLFVAPHALFSKKADSRHLAGAISE
jgi:hypothetical protein